MGTLTINRKPKGIYGTQQKTMQAVQEQSKVIPAGKMLSGNQKTQQKPAGKKSGRTMNKSQRKRQKRIMRLVEYWPELFTLKEPRPLKVGVFDDLMQDIAVRGLAFGQGALRAVVASYAQTPRYYRALIAGGPRYDLKGQPCGEVTPEEQKHATEHLEALKARDRERKASQKEPNA
ncbi:ProQ/FINO family protein [Escherichia coli]|uniref:ProQ/FINO family protein n=1 Tax=Escherichia coli TaxID=562 RepID=UPI00135E0102|nr:ProQ/FinO family protein [Escherichia coli]MXF07404.1 proQ/FINO family protein [Escherichia coli]